MRLVINEILEYYDVPQLFVALDVIKTSYLCLTYDEDDGVLQCIGIDISKEKLNDFITGHLDLRDLFVDHEQNCYDVVVDGEIVEANQRIEAIEEYMLPDKGFFYNYSQLEDQEMVSIAREVNRPVLRIAFNYEKADHLIPSKVMANTVINFQSILSKAYKKVNKDLDENDAQLDVHAKIAASFDLEFFTRESSDLFGRSKVADTLELIRPMFSDDEQDVADCLVNFKSAQSNFKSMVKDLSDNQLSFKFKWVYNSLESKVSECLVTKQQIRNLYILASSLEQLEETTETFEGSFFMANTKSGSWGFLPTTDSKQKRGYCLDQSMLNGIILNNQQYIICCKVSPSKNPHTGKEYCTYTLIEVNPI